MSNQNQAGRDQVNVKASNVTASTAGTVGIDSSTGKQVDVSASDISTPVGFLMLALQRLPVLWWGVGVGAILAVVGIISRWKVPAGALVLGGIGLFVGMFGLVI